MAHHIVLKLFILFITIHIGTSGKAQQTNGSKIDVSGNWNITISIAEGTILGKGQLSQKGDSVTGWVGPGENDPIAVKGMFKQGKLIMKTLPQPGRTVAFDTIELEVTADSLYGKFDNGSHGKGAIHFKRSK